MKVFALCIVHLAWLVPGSPHHWARRLLAERRAMLAMMEALRFREGKP
jgi:hypothetical protein